MSGLVIDGHALRDLGLADQDGHFHFTASQIAAILERLPRRFVFKDSSSGWQGSAAERYLGRSAQRVVREDLAFTGQLPDTVPTSGGLAFASESLNYPA
ncbi:hypothetical protein [Bradyrhizobium sp. CB3481]|uniref:hypothetical protein n=1 Tax=Bradyrhizobium sp. CB3481 TaxID=3039158 RepID=UPI0024B2569A|nr:hypothetical protein [Bradyrhizobium sp. CB3481]WFU16450.1 hypothetical protein QA643_36835 [Bradyrhizobium sp. CB3481]